MSVTLIGGIVGGLTMLASYALGYWLGKRATPAEPAVTIKAYPDHWTERAYDAVAAAEERRNKADAAAQIAAASRDRWKRRAEALEGDLREAREGRRWAEAALRDGAPW